MQFLNDICLMLHFIGLDSLSVKRLHIIQKMNKNIIFFQDRNAHIGPLFKKKKINKKIIIIKKKKKEIWLQSCPWEIYIN